MKLLKFSLESSITSLNDQKLYTHRQKPLQTFCDMNFLGDPICRGWFWDKEKWWDQMVQDHTTWEMGEILGIKIPYICYSLLFKVSWRHDKFIQLHILSVLDNLHSMRIPHGHMGNSFILPGRHYMKCVPMFPMCQLMQWRQTISYCSISPPCPFQVPCRARKPIITTMTWVLFISFFKKNMSVREFQRVSYLLLSVHTVFFHIIPVTVNLAHLPILVICYLFLVRWH